MFPLQRKKSSQPFWSSFRLYYVGSSLFYLSAFFMVINLASLERIFLMNSLYKNISPDISLVIQNLSLQSHCYPNQTKFLTIHILPLSFWLLLMLAFLHLGILSLSGCMVKFSLSFSKVHLKCQLVDKNFHYVVEALHVSILWDSTDFCTHLRRNLSLLILWFIYLLCLPF